MNRFAKADPERTKRFLLHFRRPGYFGANAIVVQYETDPDVVAECVPPPLKPLSPATAFACVWDMPASTNIGPFQGGALYLAAEYKGRVGGYCLAMPMSTDAAVIVGREMCGEPKKLAQVDFRREGAHVEGAITRLGITYMTLRGKIGAETRIEEGLDFHIKMLPKCTGDGLEFDKALLCGVNMELENGKAWLLEDPEIIYQESAHDPVVDIPVRKITRGVFWVADLYCRTEPLEYLTPEQAAPYIVSKFDNLDLLSALTVKPEQKAVRA